MFGDAAEFVAHVLPVKTKTRGVGVGWFAASFAQRSFLAVVRPHLGQIRAAALFAAPITRRRLVEFSSLPVNASPAAQRRAVPRVPLQLKVVGTVTTDAKYGGAKHQ